MPTAHIPGMPSADRLGMAVIAASGVPLLLLDDMLRVVSASRSFGRAFDIGMADVVGRLLPALGSGEWNGERLRSLLEGVLAGDGPLEAHAMDLLPKGRPNQRLSLDAQRLDHEGEDAVFLLLAITDLTGAYAREKRAQARLDEKDVLLLELQHRIANSLQIIASVLMQSARRVQSDETRGYLHDAHHRVLSVAAVQSHLAMSRSGNVPLRAYFTDLCRSIAASMIQDSTQLSIEVLVDDSESSPDVSMSLGLIMTELAINALKHGFPNRRKGVIKVGFESSPEGWVLSVSDNGVGMSAEVTRSSPGLGTSIVDALARKLGARVRISIGGPGTAVSICKE